MGNYQASEFMKINMKVPLCGFCIFLVCVCSFVWSSEETPFILDRISQTYLPARYNSYGPKFCLGQSTAEKVAYDPAQQILYIGGNKLVQLLDIEFPQAPVILGRVEVPGEVTDIAVCEGLVAITLAGHQDIDPGRLQLLSTYKSRSNGRPQATRVLFEGTVGVLPDMLLFTKDCSRVIVANEGSPGRASDGTLENPEGSISIVNITALFESDGDYTSSLKTINFRDWDSKDDFLLERGVRWGHESGHLFSEDAEPEYLALSQDQQTVFVNLQENNAIAIVDIEKGRVLDIKGLGMKPFGIKNNGLDASDKDNKADLKDWPIYGLYQPDSILTFTHRTQEYIVTANEGETSWFDVNSGDMWSDSFRGSSIVHQTDSLSETMKEALSDPAKLGRLTFSSLNTNNSTLVTFGSRSFSIFQADDMKLVFDSEDELEVLHAELFPWAFNAENPEQFCADQDSIGEDINIDTRQLFAWMERPRHQRGPRPKKEPLMEVEKLSKLVEDARKQLNEYESMEQPWDYGLWRPSNALTRIPEDLIDITSKETGLSPESLEIAEIGNKRLLFVGNEKGNTIFVYDASNPRKLVWQSAVYPGDYDSTFAELYTTKRIADIDPEGMKFISANHSPTREPLLVVAGSLSGTVSIYRVVALPPNYERSIKGKYSRRDPGVKVTTNDPFMTLYVNPRLL